MSGGIRIGANASSSLNTKIIGLLRQRSSPVRAETLVRGSGERPVGREVERGLAAFGKGPPTNHLMPTTPF